MNSAIKNTSANTPQPKALIMAGGTGGHIFPGLAVAKTLQQQGWTIHWLGSKGGMEEVLVSKQQIPLSLIAVAGLRGNGVLGWLLAPFTLLTAIVQARRAIVKIAPDVVLGFGGFASGPGGLAAKIMGKYLIIHEQNAVAGMTNKMLSKLADKVFQAFPETFDKKLNVETIGNPIREEIVKLTLDKVNLEVNEQLPMPTKVLVVGGSRGAQALNQQLPKIFSELLNSGQILVRHQCGKNGEQLTKNEYSKLALKQPELVSVETFIGDMAEAYAWADVVICRAGALTVSEIAAVGLAAIFIPFPFAVDDHQTLNAKWLVAKQAGMLIAQQQLDTEQAKNQIVSLLGDKKRIVDMANKAKLSAFLEAADKMAKASQNSLEKAA
jgi:UDP-N-acetylglucosamine--N-acetylmuramyl-(pentapeptide) pyrophosphoryl-undecaprenol N-acetylglucosamine transferase